MKNKSMFNHRSLIKASLFVLILMIAWQLQAEEFYHNTNITSNETWCIPDTHYVNSNISVVSGVTLTILSHDVYLQNNLTINGVLNANGAIINGTGGGLTLYDVSEECYAGNVNFNSCGVSVDNCTNTLVPTFENCNFNGSGLSIDNNSNPDIIYCVFDGEGITINHNSNPLIYECQVTAAQIGISVYWGSAPRIDDCTFNENQTGAYFMNCGQFLFTDSSVNNNTYQGLLVENSDSLCFENSNFNNNETFGVKVESINNGTSTVTFSNCVADSNGSSGIYVTGNFQASITIADSYIRYNGGGGIYSTGDLVITDTPIVSNGGDGIYATGNVTLSYVDIAGSSGCGLILPDENTIFTIIDEAGVYASDSVAFKIHPNIIGQLPAENILCITDDEVIYVFGGCITQNATWMKRINHYNVYGDVTVVGNVTLQLPTDSKIYFDNNTGLEIQGVILADSVNFEPISYGNWKGLHFYYNDLGSILNACKLERAGFRDDTSYGPAGIMIRSADQDSSVTITGCEILDGNGHGIYMYRTRPLIDNCTIWNCDGNGIDIMWSNPIIKNTAITLCDSCGIYIGSSSHNIYIDNCNISCNMCYGVYTYSSSNSGTLKNGSIHDNSGPSVRLPVEMVRDISTINIYGNQNNHQIEISGGHMDIDAVWYNDYDYILYGSPFLGEGALTLEAGTVLKFENNQDMDIRTSLTAIGTPSEHIVFTSNQPTPAPGDWEYLYFDYCAEPSQLEYCDILYGGSSNWGSVVLWEHTVNFDHCDISYSSSSGMGFWGDATANIINSEIHHNATIGVESNPWNSIAHISYTSFYNNGTYPIQAGANEIKYITDGVYITDNGTDAILVLGAGMNTGTWQNHGVPYDIDGDIQIWDDETLTIAKGDTLRFTSEYSITVEGALLAEGDADSVIVFTKYPDSRTNWNNIIFSSPDSLSKFTYCNFSFGGNNVNGMIETDNAGNLLEMSHCIIDSSVTTGLFLTNSSFPQIVNCAFTDNTGYGIHIDSVGDNNPIFGSSLAEWNDLYGNGTYELYNDNPNEIIAEYVYWGTIDEAEITAKIYTGRGAIDFTPWTNAAHDTTYPQSGIDPPQSVTISIVGTQVQINWSAVPEATSYKVYSSDNPYTGFEEDTSGTFTDESWSAPAPDGKKFYYVTANIDASVRDHPMKRNIRSK